LDGNLLWSSIPNTSHDCNYWLIRFINPGVAVGT
jgi:hypothetical protein